MLTALSALAATAVDARPREILPGIHKLRGIDPDLTHRDLRPLGKLLRRAQIVGLGEAVHTTRGFSEAKVRLFRYLVESEGFRAFGIESSWIDAEPVADYVRTCEGDPREALRGLFGVWENVAVLELVEWMCAYNLEHPEDPVHFYGFDIQAQGRANIEAIREFLGRIGLEENDERWLGVGDCLTDFFPGTPIPVEEHQRCVATLDRIWSDFDANEAEILGRVSATDLEWARIHVFGLRAWQDASFYNETDRARHFEARDEGMAYVAEAIRRIRFPEARTALWAHNGHVAKDQFIIGGADVMGVFLERRFGKRYKSIALIAHEGLIDWPAVGCGVWGTASAGSVEELLRQIGKRYLLVDLRFPGTQDKFLTPGRVYQINWNVFIVPRRHFDGLVYMKRAEKMRPLAWEPCDGG